MKKIFLILIITCFYVDLLAQNSDKEAVETVINRLFEGMKKGDSTIARSVFHQKAILQSIGFSAKTGKNYIKSDARLEEFLKAIGTQHTEIWDERPGKFEIRIDNQMAHAWVPYEFYLAGKFSHCGIDNITLYKEDKDWKIIYLVDTVRKENCLK